MTWLIVVAGALLIVLTLAGLVAARYYQPTVFSRSAPERLVTGWRRSVALVLLAPMISVALLLRVAGLLKAVDERH